MLTGLKGRHLISVNDLSGDEIHAILDLAIKLKSRAPEKGPSDHLCGRTLAMIFQKPSLRTRVSFETGMTQLGGHAIYLAPADIKLGQRETTEDIAIVLGRYVDVIMARVFGHDIVEDMAKHSPVPVINGLSDHEHPCQILADLQTILEHKGRIEGLKAVYSGDGNNVAHSLLYGAARTGMHMAVVTPPGFEPSADVVAEARQIGATTGAQIQVSSDLFACAKGADVIYTDVWASMGQETEANDRRAKFKDYQVNMKLLAGMDNDAIVLHCLPAHYGEEIDYETSRDRRSAIFDQAENRLHAQKAVLVALAGAAG